MTDEQNEQTRTVRWVSEDVEGLAVHELDIPPAAALELSLGRAVAFRGDEPRRFGGEAGKRRLRAQIAAIEAAKDQIEAEVIRQRLAEKGYSVDQYADPDDLARWLEEHGPEAF